MVVGGGFITIINYSGYQGEVDILDNSLLTESGNFILTENNLDILVESI